MSGSLLIEELTNKLEKETFKIIEKIDALGGAIEAINLNYQEQEIAKTAYEFQKSLESTESIIVGVNKYRNAQKGSFNTHKINDKAIKNQIQRLDTFKLERDNNEVENSLKKIREIALKKDVNLMPYIIQSIESKATLGEISDSLRDIFKTHQ